MLVEKTKYIFIKDNVPTLHLQQSMVNCVLIPQDTPSDLSSIGKLPFGYQVQFNMNPFIHTHSLVQISQLLLEIKN